jgi:large subunit ribosomal protein L30
MKMTSINATHLKVIQTRSIAGTSKTQRRIIKSLGLKGIGRSNVLPNLNPILGQLNKVLHMVRVEPASAPSKGK